MIDHPFLDFKNLTDDELLNKAIDIQKKLLKANMWGSSQDIIGQLNWMIEMIEEEKGERLFKQNHEQTNAMFPKVIESDPSLIKDKTETDDKPGHGKPLTNPKKVSSFPTSFHKEYISSEDKNKPKPKPKSE